MSQDEFWPYYVSEHLNPTNRRLHFVGTSLGLICAVFALVFLSPAFFALALFFGYGFAWVGHFGFERNKPATFKYPRLSFLADFRMYGLIARGRMDEEIRRLGPELARLRRG
ncbi:MAG: DUF962 domain-containing protein [Elusimicrobiota bacterium]|nr:MAG: DUF962 domain-containing protein [Elusimicrobiota bacterium]